MPDGEFVLAGPENIVINGETAERLIGSKNPDAALVYLYILSRHGRYRVEDAAQSLGMSPARVETAMSVLGGMGLVSGSQPRRTQRLEPADEIPPYTVKDVIQELEEGAAFAGLVRDVQRSIGKKLSTDDTLKLFGIYDGIGMPPEVILLLITHCVGEYQKKYGKDRMPTMRYVEKAAFTWEHRGLLTLERAERYINEQLCRQSMEAEVCRALQMRDREPTYTERKYINEWLNMGFDVQAIEMAYDRTMVKLDKRSWQYMDGILSRWHQKGLHKAEEIEAHDTKNPDADAGSAGEPKTSPTQQELQRMRKLLEKMKEQE